MDFFLFDIITYLFLYVKNLIKYFLLLLTD
jgi:hypothetical protein